jgi:hypothetical protein
MPKTNSSNPHDSLRNTFAQLALCNLRNASGCEMSQKERQHSGFGSDRMAERRPRAGSSAGLPRGAGLAT